MDNSQRSCRSRFSKRRENVVGGIILLAIGGILFARQAGANIPGWLFTWPMIPILVGIFVGIKTGFRDFGWLLFVGVGVFFLLDRMDQLPIKEYILPIVVLGAGVLVLFGAFFRQPRNKISNQSETDGENKSYRNDPNATTDDVMEVVSVFGSAKRVVLSKNFKGGEVVSVFGSAEINLINADFTGRLVLEVVQVFGGTKIIVPPHWEVQSKTAAIFGGIEDKRSVQGSSNPEKVLVLEGATFFGGVTISSY